jgi:hypothetical protein
LVSHHRLIPQSRYPPGRPALFTADAIAGTLARSGGHVMDGAHDVILGARFPRADAPLRIGLIPEQELQEDLPLAVNLLISS